MNKNEITHNNTLINALAPRALSFEGSNSSFVLDTYHCTGIAATKYPSKIDFEWLTEICNLNNTVTALSWYPEKSPDIILKDISNTISQNQVIAEGHTTTDPLEIIRAQKVVADGSKLIDQIANNNEAIGTISINSLVFGKDKDDLKLKTQVVKNKYSGRMFNASILPFMQKDIFKAVCPCDNSSELLKQATNQLLPSSSLWGGFPFAFSGYNDGEGAYWGKDSSGGLIIVDIWKRGGDRTNSNIVMLGVSGVGKSTTLKHLILNEWERGTKIILVDPHGEYKDLCKELDGDWIDITGGVNRINPFHIYAKSDESDEEEKQEGNELSKHINNLEVFFNLYLSLTPVLSACLKECIEKTYEIKHITWETQVDKLKATDYPIMKDLYEVVLKRSEQADKELRPSEKNDYKELGILLRSVAIGSDSFIWNGHSTVSPTKDFIVFDTTAVNKNTANIKTALYHTILNYVEDYLYRNKSEQAIAVLDEAHNAIDARLPATVTRLANIEKTVRKFESALWICSQELIDFLDKSIEKAGRTLLDQPNIKLLMPVGKGTDLQALKDLYKLTDAEEERLMQTQRGKGLLLIGSRHLTIDFDIPPHHMALMGSGGGR